MTGNRGELGFLFKRGNWGLISPWYGCNSLLIQGKCWQGISSGSYLLCYRRGQTLHSLYLERQEVCTAYQQEPILQCGGRVRNFPG